VVQVDFLVVALLCLFLLFHLLLRMIRCYYVEYPFRIAACSLSFSVIAMLYDGLALFIAQALELALFGAFIMEFCRMTAAPFRFEFNDTFTSFLPSSRSHVMARIRDMMLRILVERLKSAL
jgi:hypothetical protein